MEIMTGSPECCVGNSELFTIAIRLISSRGAGIQLVIELWIVDVQFIRTDAYDGT